MDICPLPRSSCYLTSSCFLRISSSQSFWSQPPCCQPCLAPLTERSFLAGFPQRWMLLPSSLQPPCFSRSCNPAAALLCHAPNICWCSGLPPAGSSSLLLLWYLMLTHDDVNRENCQKAQQSLWDWGRSCFSRWLVSTVTLLHGPTPLNLRLQERTR